MTRWRRRPGLPASALLLLLAAAGTAARAADPSAADKALRDPIEALYTPDYLLLKDRILREFSDAKPGRFGRFVPGVRRDLDTKGKVLALTFDACKERGYNSGLIEFLRKEGIPATLFVTGLWIDAHPKLFLRLAADPLFEIENHGLRHRLCSVDGESKYGVIATRDVGEVVDEMELNARKIEKLTGRRPLFFRSATTYTDETAARVARQLGMEVVSFGLLPGDTVRSASAQTLADNILRGARNGDIVIMHFNHPLWKEEAALRLAVPVLRERGFTFVKLQDFMLQDTDPRRARQAPRPPARP